jgi:hypothetical protein
MTVTLRVCPLLFVVAAGCANKASQSDAAPAPSASASAPVAATTPPSASARPPPPAPPECKAISVVGSIKITPMLTGADAGLAATLVDQGELPESTWLDLDPGAKFTAKHPHSTREVTFTGPGRARSCVMRGEEAWLAKGTFNSVPSSGERPGGEEWLITPAGAVRYASANVEVIATAAKTEVKLSSGTAYAWTGDQASAVKPPATPLDAGVVADGWIRLDGKRSVTLTAKSVSPEESAKAGLERCSAEAKAAKELATAVGRPDAALAQSAPQHVIARRIARVSCDVASLRINLLPPSPARDAMITSLRQSEIDWRSIRPRGMRGRPLP